YCLAEFGGYVYSGGSDFKIAQWSAEDGKVIRVLHGHTNYVRCLYAEGNAVVSGSDDCTVRVWDAGSGEAQLTGHFHGRAGVSALCRVGVTMWSGDNDGRVIAWKLNTCEALRVLHAHGGRVASLRKIGSRVYSGGADGIIAVFDAEDCQLVQRIEDHRGARITALVGPAELRRFCIWSCGTDSKIRCWFQDEYVPMTDDQERFAEGFWYLTGSTPYREFRESVLRQNNFLRDKLIVSEKQNTRMLDLLNFSNASLTPKHMQRREASTMEEYQLAKERLESVENELQMSKERLKDIDNETRTVLELLRVARAELGVLDFPALQSLSGTKSNVAPGVPGANTVQLSPPVTTGTKVSAATLPPWGSFAPGVVRLLPVLREGVSGVGVDATPNTLDTNAFSSSSPAPTYGVKAASFSAGLGKQAQPVGGTGVTTAATQPFSATTQPLGGTGVTTATTQPFSATTQPLGGTGVTTATAQPFSATTQPLGGTGVTTATAQPFSATTQPLGGTGVTTATTQPFSATTQPLGGTGVTTATAQPFSATTQPLGGTGVAPASSVSTSGIQAVQFSTSPPEHKDALLEALARAGAVEGARSWKGVEWTNKNVGHYIQRRFYGGEPSLRAPDLEKRRRRGKRLPKIRLVPLSEKRSPGEMSPTSP
ncbi:hypothetical protein TcCL_NonESM03411, partial [Trypanosoma cruzi]